MVILPDPSVPLTLGLNAHLVPADHSYPAENVFHDTFAVMGPGSALVLGGLFFIVGVVLCAIVFDAILLGKQRAAAGDR